MFVLERNLTEIELFQGLSLSLLLLVPLTSQVLDLLFQLLILLGDEVLCLLVLCSFDAGCLLETASQ